MQIQKINQAIAKAAKEFGVLTTDIVIISNRLINSKRPIQYTTFDRKWLNS